MTFWLANNAGGSNDFSVKWNGQTLLALNDEPAQGYTEYTYQVTGSSGSTSNLEFDFRQAQSIEVWTISRSWIMAALRVVVRLRLRRQRRHRRSSVRSRPTAMASTPPARSTWRVAPEAGSTVTVFDGSSNLGSTAVDGSGNWTFTEANAADGTHNFTATDTDASGTSNPSAAFPVTVNTSSPPPPQPPAPPVINSFSPDTNGIDRTHTVTLAGSAEAGSTVTVFDGDNNLGDRARCLRQLGLHGE